MFHMGFYNYGYDDDDGRIDRSDWAIKSAAATRREAEARKLFDAFLESCQGLTPTHFPVTEQVVGADIHLTNPCWLDFRKYVQSKGCTAKRREATLAERKDTHNHKQRRGKMYLISVTVPGHPSQAVAISKQKQEEAAAAAVERKAKATDAQKRKQQRETDHKDEVQETYEQLTSSSPDKSVGSNLQPFGNTTKPVQMSTPKQVVLTPVQTCEVLEHAEQVYLGQLRDIRESMCMEKREFQENLESKRQLEANALEEYKRAKRSILDASPDNAITCSICQKHLKIAAAACITKACKSSVCGECLRTKVKDQVKCVVCERKGEKNELLVPDVSPSKKRYLLLSV
jgi:hypothetical protein